MSKPFALGFLLLSLVASAADAQVIDVQCERQSTDRYSNISNVYRYDLTIDLAKKTVHVRQFSTLKDNDDQTAFYRNHKNPKVVNSPGMDAKRLLAESKKLTDSVLDPDQFVIVSNETVKWGFSPPSDDAAVYYLQQKTMVDIDKYVCTDVPQWPR